MHKPSWVPSVCQVGAGDLAAAFGLGVNGEENGPQPVGAVCGLIPPGQLAQEAGHGVFGFTPRMDRQGRSSPGR